MAKRTVQSYPLSSSADDDATRAAELSSKKKKSRSELSHRDSFEVSNRLYQILTLDESGLNILSPSFTLNAS